jgi:branched-chain amino acid transport system ATP-binding protein
MEALKLDKVYKSYGGLKILNDLSLIIGQGEYVGVIGPNGAGKTTLLNVITGALSCNSGQIFIFGHNVTNLPTYERVHLGLGRSFQVTSLLSDLSVLQNILLALHGMKPSRYQMLRAYDAHSELLTKAHDLLQSINLWEKKDEPAKSISYGEQRKLEIVLSLASESRLLLLDEPTAGLSIAEVPVFVNTIKTLATGTTVLFTSHDMDVVFALAHRVVVLYYGQIIAKGTPEEIRGNLKVREIYLGIEENGVHAQAS